MRLKNNEPDKERPVTIELLGQKLTPKIIQDLLAAGMTPGGAVGRALESHIFERFQAALAGRLLKPPTLRFFGSSLGSGVTLPELAAGGYETWYPEIQFVTARGDHIRSLKIEAKGIELRPIQYGGGVARDSVLKVIGKKTQTNHVYRINHLVIPGRIFKPVLKRFTASDELAQPLIANFKPGPDIEDFRSVAFDHMVTQKRSFCECARAAHAQWVVQARARAEGYAPNSWPHEVVKLYTKASYQEGICHLCIARSVSAEEAARRYGVSIEMWFEAYLDQVRFDLKLDAKTAREDIKERLGLSRWVREAELYRITCDLFPGLRVLREASPEWLGRMRLDIYLPELALVIEHQGEQHFRPIAGFGGEAAHQRVLERDALKRRLCQEHGIYVVDVRFDTTITAAAMRHRLRRFLEAASRLRG